LDALGSGSDYSSFIQHAGVPAINLGYGGEGSGGEYHSIYDSYDNYTRFKDPGFQYGVTLAQTAGRAILRMANADILPFDFTHLAKTIEKYSDEIMDLLENTREKTELDNKMIVAGAFKVGEDPTKNYKIPGVKDNVPYLDFSPLQNALAHLAAASDSLKKVVDYKIKNNSVSAAFNQSLYRAEQQLLTENGLPRRKWYRHSIYAPGFYTGYGVKTLPGIREAIEQREWKEAQEQIQADAGTIDQLANYLTNLAAK
jgi:N-acetylated-alpha-linked acidic dipeptidase